MAYEQKDNTGSLFKNQKREKDTHPNATGSCLIDGVEYWVSAWTKEGKNGVFQSLAFKKKEAKDAPKDEFKAESKKHGMDGFDDDIPF